MNSAMVLSTIIALFVADTVRSACAALRCSCAWSTLVQILRCAWYVVFSLAKIVLYWYAEPF